MKLVDTYDPIALFEKASANSDADHVSKFMMMIKHLYQYQIFKKILDLSASLIRSGFLTFKLHDKRFFDLDEGNCKTIYGSKINSFFNAIRPRNIYLITLKKLSYDVVVHEISHMVEKEAKINLEIFSEVINSDIVKRSDSIGLRNAIDNVLVKEVEAYPKSQHGSELFARYFQIMAMSKEVSGLSSSFGYSITQSDSHFAQTKEWLDGNSHSDFTGAIDPTIANTSKSYIKKIEEIKHKWSEQKVNSIHGASKKWSKVTKSIKDF